MHGFHKIHLLEPEWFYNQDKDHKRQQIIEYFQTLSSTRILGPEHYDTHTSNTSPPAIICVQIDNSQPAIRHFNSMLQFS